MGNSRPERRRGALHVHRLNLYENTIAGLNTAFANHMDDMVEDIPKYTNIEPIAQIENWPFGSQPLSGAILVLIHVSSMKTRRSGSRRACSTFQRRRRRATSARPCSRANRLFKRNPSRRRNVHTI